MKEEGFVGSALNRVYAFAETLEERAQRSPTNQLLLGLAVLGFTWLVSFPHYEQFGKMEGDLSVWWTSHFGHLQTKIDHPLGVQSTDPNNHDAQAYYRIVPILVAKMLGGDLHVLFVVMPLLLIPFTVLMFRLGHRLLPGRPGGIALSVLCMLGFVGKSFTYDTIGFFDSFSFVVLAAAAYVGSPVLMAGWIGVGMFCDERILLAVPFLILDRLLQSNGPGSLAPGLGKVLRHPAVAWTVAVLVLVVGVRYGIKTYSGFQLRDQEADLGLVMIRKNWQYWPLGMLSGVEGFGLLLGLLPVAVGYAFGRLWGWLAGLYVLLALAAPVLVVDMTRSYSFLFIGAIPALRALARTEGATSTFRILGAATAFSAVIPPFMVFSSRINYHPPVTPQNLLEFFHHLMS